MIGGLKKTASAFAIAAAAGVMSTSAFAADLGGNCCADLEERVAELEATTARKGNRVVSLTISGHVNEALLFWDDDVNSGARIVTNGYSMTRFRFRGDAKITADWSAGFYIELGLGRTGMSYDVDQVTGAAYGGYGVAPGIRHQALYIDSKHLGRIWMGHTTDAVDGIIDICLGCPITSSPESGLGWDSFFLTFGNASTGIRFDQLRVGNEGHYGTRRNLIKYISPAFAGFTFSASWGDDDNGNYAVTPPIEHDYIWDVALRYANEFNGVRFAAGIGYTEYTGVNNQSSWAGAASIAHVATGLYVQAAFAHKDLPGVAAGLDDDDDMWSVQIGIAQKWNALGKTTFWIQYQEYDNGFSTSTFNDGVNGALNVLNTDADIISFGVNQQIDAAAMELYLTYWNVQTDVSTAAARTGLGDANFFMAGARIRF